jgi:hypothetical protein
LGDILDLFRCLRLFLGICGIFWAHTSRRNGPNKEV